MSGRLRAFAVDDEPLALRSLVGLLKETGRVEVVGSATEPEAALQALTAQPVDVVFLDIRMPGMSGFDLLERLPGEPLVVFITGYDQYAVQAFEVNAVDYLLKPVERERLERTLDRLESLRDDPARGEFRGVMERLARYLRRQTPAFLERVPVRAQERVHFLDVAQATHFLADGKQTVGMTAGGRHVVDQLLGDLEGKLDPVRFVRINRGTIVNLAWIDEVHPWPGGRLQLRLKDSGRTELIVARDRVPALRERLGL